MNFLKFISKYLASLQARLFLSLIFLIILPLFSLIARLISPKKPKSGWDTWSINSESIDDLRQQS